MFPAYVHLLVAVACTVGVPVAASSEKSTSCSDLGELRGTLPLPQRELVRATPIDANRQVLAGTKGSLSLLVLVDETGTVEDACVMQATPGLDEQPAIEEVLRWRYEPARSAEGEAVWSVSLVQFRHGSDPVPIIEEDPFPFAEPLVAGVGGVANPRRKEYFPPVYPRKARRQGVSAKVYLLVVIRKDGSVDGVEVLRCTEPGRGFEEAAIDSARRWRFEPATLMGRALDVRLTLNITFDVNLRRVR